MGGGRGGFWLRLTRSPTAGKDCNGPRTPWFFPRVSGGGSRDRGIKKAEEAESAVNLSSNENITVGPSL